MLSCSSSLVLTHINLLMLMFFDFFSPPIGFLAMLSRIGIVLTLQVFFFLFLSFFFRVPHTQTTKAFRFIMNLQLTDLIDYLSL